jgi:hypothetical protein
MIALLALAAGVPALAANVGVSIGINQPGVYGRVDIGQVAAPPVLVYEQPVVVVPGPVAHQQRPIYLHVPPAQASDWRHHCAYYAACGQRVYFVRDDWYREHYVRRGPPGRALGHEHRRDPDERGHGRGHGHDSGREHGERGHGDRHHD